MIVGEAICEIIWMRLNIEKLAQGTADLNDQLLEDTLYEVALTELENDVPEIYFLILPNPPNNIYDPKSLKKYVWLAPRTCL